MIKKIDDISKLSRDFFVFNETQDNIKQTYAQGYDKLQQSCD